MKLLALAFFVVVLTACMAYVFLNVALAAWMFRSAKKSFLEVLDSFRKFWIAQYESIPSETVWNTFAVQVFLMAIVIWTIKTPTNIFALPVILIGSAFFISASIVSFIAKMPFLLKLWESVFTKLLVLALPISLHFFAKAFASEQLASLLNLSASNVPITHVASTFFFLLLFSAVLFGVASVVFEVVFLLSIAMDVFKRSPSENASIHKPANLALLMLSTKPVLRSVDRLRMMRAVRRVSISLVLFSSFFACILLSQTAVRFHVGRLVQIVLHAMVFEFDAIPARYCQLPWKDEEAARSKHHEVKVLPSSSSQEKAFVLRRGATLLEPVVFAELPSPPPDGKSLSVEGVVDCLAVRSDPGADPGVR